jgi:hypothetical protein
MVPPIIKLDVTLVYQKLVLIYFLLSKKVVVENRAFINVKNSYYVLCLHREAHISFYKHFRFVDG